MALKIYLKTTKPNYAPPYVPHFPVIHARIAVEWAGYDFWRHSDHLTDMLDDDK